MSLNDKILQALGLWRRKLLDLSKRNKALNFKPTKVTTIAIVDEQPGVVFEYLFTDGKQMKFLPILPSKKESDTGTDYQQMGLFETDKPEDSTEYDNSVFQPYKVEELEDRHTDNLLQCNCSPENLDTSLRRIEEILQSNIEEQGVHTLFLSLGMLYYTESENSEETFRAPIILLPVIIERKSARSGYTVMAGQDDPMVNPTLVEYLKQSFNICLPEVPDFTEESDFDLQEYFIKIVKQIEKKKNWSLKNDIFLAHFTFQKFVMFKDIERNAEVFKEHRLVTQLVSKEQASTVWGLPVDIQRMNLDNDFPPEETFTILDADSSQLRAMAAISKGHDIVLEGPPGTGKSQTIVNIIAQGLSQNKSILFVSEKLAALQVVHRRLKEAGLAEFCLELHSTKGNRKVVIDELRKTLDSSLLPAPSAVKVSNHLKDIRTQLTEYANKIHNKIEPLGLSPFEAFGCFGEVFDNTEIQFEGTVKSLTKSQIDDAVSLLKQIVTISGPIGQIKDHPWHDAEKSYYSQTNLIKIKQCSTQTVKLLSNFIKEIKFVVENFGLEEPNLFDDFEAQSQILETLLCSPDISAEIIKEQKWTQPPVEIVKVIEQGLKFKNIETSLLEKYHQTVFENGFHDEISYIENIKTGVTKHLAIFSKRYRLIKKHWQSLILDKKGFSISDSINDLKLADECIALKFILDNVSKTIVSCFDNHWHGSASDWATLNEIIEWISKFNSELLNVKFTDKIYKAAKTVSLSKGQIKTLQNHYVDVRTCIDILCKEVGWAQTYFENTPIAEILERISLLDEYNSKGAQWAAFVGAMEKVNDTIAEKFLRLAYSGEISLIDMPKIFLRSVYQALIDSIISEDKILKDFHSLSHDEKVNYFKHLDENIKNENRASLISNMRFAAQERLDSPMAQEGMVHLRREFARQRRFTPLRQTIKQSEYAIRSIKPCFLMSPLSVAQYLQGGTPNFDLVVFDEASQLPTEDAIGAICRGKQLIVVGDPKQLPPTNFFTLQSSIINAEVDEQGNNVIEDTESVLEEFLATGIPSARLKWHYRSTNENLISFSNYTFYDSDLFTFPSCFLNNEQSGLHFKYIPKGVYEGKGLNKIEATAVVDAIVEHAKENNGLSLGVGTFNLRQQLAILDEIEIRRRKDPSLEPFFDRSKVEPFFVKNLENIQGDERDVIFISVTYAKDITGRLRYNFGPINNENGWRRLNVLITRARKKMIVFSSIKGDEISPAVISSRGPQLIRDFLLFAEHGKIQSTSLGNMLETESPFEKDVMLELMNRGYLVDPQVGASGYRIDFGIRHILLPGLYICGIECDGVTYHSSETARDRDRLRQAVLESRGWQIIRIWSTDWFKERNTQIQRIIDFIENAKQTRIDQGEDEKEKFKNIEEDHKTNDIFSDTGNEEKNDQNSLYDRNYKRPTVPSYKMYQLSECNYQVNDSSLDAFTQALTGVIYLEGPIHWDFAFTRVSNFWWHRRGNRIESTLKYTLRKALSKNLFNQKDDFLYKEGQAIQVRNREGLKLTADYICPEEREAAILLVVEAAKMVPREKLIAEVIAVLGVVRTPASKTAIDKSIKTLLDKKMLGEGSKGLARKNNNNLDKSDRN
jgi:very-short-patch-repair endonuclease